MSEDLVLRTKDHLHRVLTEEAEKNHCCLARRNPEKWLHYAEKIIQGASPFTLAKKNNEDPRTLVRIRDGLWPSTQELRDEFKRRLVDGLEINIEAHHAASMAFVENMEDPESRKKITGKDIKELTIGAQAMVNTITRLEGGPDRVVEHRHQATPEEYEELLKGIPEAEIVEVEE